MLVATTVTTNAELDQVLHLQQKYLVTNIDKEEMQSQGFVTVQHTPELLQQMHSLAPSIVIKNGDEVVAYALVMLNECRHLVPVLVPMFNSFDQLTWKGNFLSGYSFYVMGQICVAKEYRGQGLFDMLYHKHREVYQPQFDFIVTEVATRNKRSLRAHERVGFETIHVYTDELDEWAVVLWDWK
jgi:ribosomal protein S18 acetylase RimI-like enzyme